MKELPQNKFFEGFYIWFNKDKKEEYYATPLYMHNTNFNMDNDNRTLKIYMKKEKFDGLKYPAVINFPYVESFGMMLLQFLNADFSTFDKAYKTFFYAYGFELLKEYVPYWEILHTNLKTR